MRGGSRSTAKRIVTVTILLGALAALAAVALAAAGPADPVIGAGPSSPTNATGAAFTFSAPPAGGSNQCRLDAGAFGACSTPTTKTYTALAAGAHTFQVQALDNKGKASNAVSYSWTIDLTEPSAASVTRLDPTPTNSSSLRWSVTFSESVSGVDAADFTLVTTGVSGASVTGVAGSGASYTVTASSGSGDGTIALRVNDDDSVRDLAGNRLGGTGTGNGTVTGPAYTLDRTPPGVAPSISAGPSGSVASTSAAFTFSSSETGVAGFACSLDGTPFAACTSPRSLTGLQQGGHTFAVRALDAAGNPGPTAVRTWIVDTVVPGAPRLDQKPPDPSSTATTTFAWSATSSDTAAFECSRENGAFEACSSPLTYAAPTTNSGLHQFAVRARDAAGTVSAVTTYGWKVDKGSPQRFTISGSVSGLTPGVLRRIPVTLANPNDAPIYVTSLTTTLSTGLGACGPANYEVLQSSASDAGPILVPAAGSVTLSGSLESYAPRVRLVDLPVNQDACKGAVVTLSYTGSAHS